MNFTNTFFAGIIMMVGMTTTASFGQKAPVKAVTATVQEQVKVAEIRAIQAEATAQLAVADAKLAQAQADIHVAEVRLAESEKLVVVREELAKVRLDMAKLQAEAGLKLVETKLTAQFQTQLVEAANKAAESERKLRLLAEEQVKAMQASAEKDLEAEVRFSFFNFRGKVRHAHALKEGEKKK